MVTSGGDSGSSGTSEKKAEGGFSASSATQTGVAGHRPAETLTAFAGALGAAATQLLDVENAAVISVLIALVGLLPALVTWLVEIGKKWDGADPAAGGNEAEAELAYMQAKLLREASISEKPSNRVEAIRKIREAFGTSPASAPEKPPDTSGKLAPTAIEVKGE